VLPAEIFLTAQTFGMRARMAVNGKTAPTQATASPPEKLEAALGKLPGESVAQAETVSV
jgi:hypothetical protein